LIINERKLIMKKLTYALSALMAVAGFSSAASADVSVSGSGSVTLSSGGSQTDVILASGVAFALSTTTANGMTISTSGSVSNGSDQGTGTAATVAGGFNAVAFGVGGSTITVGKVEVPNGHGDIGGVVSDMTKQAGGSADSTNAGFGVNGTIEAAGLSLSTAVGGASLTLGYVYDTSKPDAGNIGAGNNVMGVAASMPMGSFTLGLGYTTDGTQTETGASAALALGNGTLTVGYGQTTASAANETVMGTTYATSLDADTTVTVGYKNTKAAESETIMGLALSRSLGGGASVFLEAENYSQSGATDIGIGTSFAF
jgi:hypothetical protein